MTNISNLFFPVNIFQFVEQSKHLIKNVIIELVQPNYGMVSKTTKQVEKISTHQRSTYHDSKVNIQRDRYLHI